MEQECRISDTKHCYPLLSSISLLFLALLHTTAAHGVACSRPSVAPTPFPLPSVSLVYHAECLLVPSLSSLSLPISEVVYTTSCSIFAKTPHHLLQCLV